MFLKSASTLPRLFPSTDREGVVVPINLDKNKKNVIVLILREVVGVVVEEEVYVGCDIVGEWISQPDKLW